MPETSLLDESIAKLEALKRKRTSLKARITRIQNFVSNFQSNDNDVSPLETRKTFIEQIFKEYDEVQTEIESLDLSSEAIETQTQDRDEIDLCIIINHHQFKQKLDKRRLHGTLRPQRILTVVVAALIHIALIVINQSN
jgi:DNA repair exonuclease SbcCD ATPase subunit